METEFQEEIKNVLQQKFEGMQVDLGPAGASSRISGVLLWDGFAEMDFTERQRVVWDRLREALGARSTDVSTLMTLTEHELREYEKPSD